MEGVRRKVKWEVYLRVDRHTPQTLPRTHPLWQAYSDMTSVMYEITRPINGQLHEDTKWKE